MKSIDDLRKAFFGWRQPLSRDNALRGGIETSRILDKLTDPTPITEAGLRELGFHLADIPGKHRIFSLGETAVHIDADGGCEIDANDFSGYVKTIGQLRMLLLGVGE